jgi:hypothetical protein
LPWGAVTAYLETSRKKPGGKTVQEAIPIAAAVADTLPKRARPVG